MRNFETMCKHILIAFFAFGVMGCASTTNIEPIEKYKNEYNHKELSCLGR